MKKDNFDLSKQALQAIRSEQKLRSKLSRQIKDLIPAYVLKRSIAPIPTAGLSKPTKNSCRLDGNLWCGEYPGYDEPNSLDKSLQGILNFGVNAFIDLTEEGEMPAYEPILPAKVSYIRFPIPKYSLPTVEQVEIICKYIDDCLAAGMVVYLHSLEGPGRTEVIAGCWLEWSNAEDTGSDAWQLMRERCKDNPRYSEQGARIPGTRKRKAFIVQFDGKRNDASKETNSVLKSFARVWSEQLGNSADRMEGKNPVDIMREPVTAEELGEIYPMPRSHIVLPMNLPISNADFELLKLGHRAKVMEDHWNAYYEDGYFHWIRSWTGCRSFSAHFCKRENDYLIDELLINHAYHEMNMPIFDPIYLAVTFLELIRDIICYGDF